LVKSKRFCQFDHGVVKNLAVYGSATPPDYDLTKITMPLILFYGTSDQLLPSSNIIKLAKIIPSAKLYEMKDYGHFDFLAHKTNWRTISNDIIANAKAYSHL
jgi:lysosomal acid lipase/cholesteryl ester hydrolase